MSRRRTRDHRARRELGNLGATARGERGEHESAGVDLGRQILRDGALIEIGEYAGGVERTIRSDHSGPIAIETERERRRDRDAIEHSSALSTHGSASSSKSAG